MKKNKHHQLNVGNILGN